MDGIAPITAASAARFVGVAMIKGHRPTRIPDDPHGIRARREALGLTQRDLAEMAGTNHARVQALETSTPTGRHSTSTQLRAIVDALDAAERRKRDGSPTAMPSRAPVPAPTRTQPTLSRGRTPVFALDVDADGFERVTEVATAYLRTPEHMENIPGVFAISKRQSGMIPMYRPGDVLVANPFGVPQAGSGLILLASDSARLLVREYVSETESEWIVKRYGSDPAEEAVKKEAFPKAAIVQAIIPGR